MENSEIKNRVRKVYSFESLLALINDIRRENLGIKDSDITIYTLKYYSNPNNTRNRYDFFHIPKKSGGKRAICSPEYPLKEIQDALKIILEAIYTPSTYATAFSRGRSIKTNASFHVGMNYVYNIDLKDFFPSISQARVWKRLQYPPFNFRQPLVNIFAGLLSVKIFPSKLYPGDKVKYFLPQGAPTSPIISNAICDSLDYKLGGLAKKYNLNYSRYADDITFSSMHNVYQDNSNFNKELKSIIEEQGFIINEKKVRLQKRGSRQEVTGIVVCNKLNVHRQYTRELRQMLYIWRRYGYEDLKFVYSKKHFIHDTKFDIKPIIKGKLSFLKDIKGENDQVYITLLNEYNDLVNSLKETNKFIDIISTFTYSDFEKIFGEIKFKNINGHIGAYTETRNKMRRKVISVSRRIKDVENNKDKLEVSRCRRRDGSIFYLVHYEFQKKLIRHTRSNGIHYDSYHNQYYYYK